MKGEAKNMAGLVLHQASRLSEFGVRVKRVSSTLPEELLDYAHRDDYYVFGRVSRGTCRIAVDFAEYALGAGDMVCVCPYQAHQVVDKGEAEAVLLFVDAALLDVPAKRLLAEYAVSPRPFQLDREQVSEWEALIAAISRRMGQTPLDDMAKWLICRLAVAAAGVALEAVGRAIGGRNESRRALEIVAAFRKILQEEKGAAGEIVRHAETLRISRVYLNEVVKSVTGMSVSRYVRRERVLQARRLLLYTELSVKEIAAELGYDDSAYFTRLFTKETGVPPSVYRKKHLG